MYSRFSLIEDGISFQFWAWWRSCTPLYMPFHKSVKSGLLDWGDATGCFSLPRCPPVSPSFGLGRPLSERLFSRRSILSMSVFSSCTSSPFPVVVGSWWAGTVGGCCVGWGSPLTKGRRTSSCCFPGSWTFISGLAVCGRSLVGAPWLGQSRCWIRWGSRSVVLLPLVVLERGKLGLWLRIIVARIVR